MSVFRTTLGTAVMVTAGLLLVLSAQTGCESSEPPSVSPSDGQNIEGSCAGADECLLLPPPTDCDGDWFCEEGMCQHQCTFAGCETAADCTIEQLCVDGACVDDVSDAPPLDCIVTGCSSEICAAETTESTCADLVEYECLVLTTCGNFGIDGTCGWDQTEEYLDCLAAFQDPVDPCAEVTCLDAESCIDGVCVPNDVEVPECETDADCPDGEICELGACEGKDDEPDPPDGNCYVSGCSGEICSTEFMVESDCSWLPEYECLLFTVCGPYGPDGACGWQPNDQYLDCLDGATVPPDEDCTSDEDCLPKEVCLAGACTTKPPLPPGACWSSADCKAGAQCINGMCVGGGGNECIATGCSGEICAPMEMMSDCSWLPEYDCLQYTECGAYGLNGLCHWAKTPEYLECLLGIDGPGPGPNQGMCTSDADCMKPGSKCNANEVCLPPPDGGMETVCWGECVPKEAGDSCNVNADCPGDMNCECVGPGGPPLPNALPPPCFLQCVPDDDPPPVDDELCISDADCKEPATKCNSNENCLAPPDGGAADVCWGECVPTEEGDSCNSNADCPSDMTCECGGFGGPNFLVPCMLQCTPVDEPPPAEGLMCFQDGDCPPGQICDPGGPGPWAGAPGGAPPPPMMGACMNPCIATGCSGIVCANEPVISTCEAEPSYACYAQDVCGAFGDGGGCKWQGTDAFDTCMSGFDNQ